jgi:hypothetical protein
MERTSRRAQALAELGLVDAQDLDLGFDFAQAARCDDDGYVIGAPVPRPAYDQLVCDVIAENASPWDPPGGPYAIGIAAADGKTIYRVVRVSGIGELVHHVEPLCAAGFKDLLASAQHPKWDAILIPTEELLSKVTPPPQPSPAARIAGPLEDLAAAQSQLDDLPPTEREQTVLSRIGQGRFREALLAEIGARCWVTNLAFEPLLRASHIRPWRDATNQQRLDADNGLLLRADLDALFDRGYISFDDFGVLLRSPALDGDTLGALLGALDAAKLTDAVMTAARRAYLAHHRERVFLR